MAAMRPACSSAGGRGGVARAGGGRAAAHPLGNFTINRFSRSSLGAAASTSCYVLDLAEIPTFQARGDDPHAYARRIAAERPPRRWTGGRRDCAGCGEAPIRPGAAACARPGWRSCSPGRSSTGPSLALPRRQLPRPASAGRRSSSADHGRRAREREASVSDELRAYPKDLLQSPLDVTSATAVAAGSGSRGRAGAHRAASSRQAPAGVADSGFARLIEREPPTGWVAARLACDRVLLGRGARAQPGHGKSIVTAYLVGSRGTAADAAAARPHGDRHAHDRRLRARAHDAQPVRTSWCPRSSTPG